MSTRREFTTLLGAGAAWPLAARAQQRDRVRRVGVLMSTSATDPYQRSNFDAFVGSFQKLGWALGRDVVIDDRWGAGEIDRMRGYARELVDLRPEVILVQGSALPAMRQETHTIPIVFVLGSEPVAQGFVRSLADPGGNITGFTHLEVSMGGKWLQLLNEIAPSVRRVGYVFNPNTALLSDAYLHTIKAGALSLSLEAISAPVHSGAEIESVIVSFAHNANGGLIVASDAFTVDHRDHLINLAARYHLPVVYPFSTFCRGGGLISYGVDVPDLFRRAASYIDRILKGGKPSELPVQQPTKFELVINLKTAKALDLQVPPTLLATADEVIE